jgi:hypothetical protein
VGFGARNLSRKQFLSPYLVLRGLAIRVGPGAEGVLMWEHIRVTSFSLVLTNMSDYTQLRVRNSTNQLVSNEGFVLVSDTFPGEMIHHCYKSSWGPFFFFSFASQ